MVSTVTGAPSKRSSEVRQNRRVTLSPCFFSKHCSSSSTEFIITENRSRRSSSTRSLAKGAMNMPPTIFWIFSSRASSGFALSRGAFFAGEVGVVCAKAVIQRGATRCLLRVLDSLFVLKCYRNLRVFECGGLESIWRIYTFSIRLAYAFPMSSLVTINSADALLQAIGIS